MKMHQKLKGGFTLVELLVVIVIIAALAGLAAPMVMRQRKKADQTEALNNARQIGFALLEFDSDYGRFPSAATADSVKDNTGTTWTLTSGNDSNGFFRQLIAAGIANSESIFYAKTAYSTPPDNVLTTEAQALEAGEVGFGYIMNGTASQSASGNPGRPVICAPLQSGSSTLFDREIFDQRAVILKLDLSAVSININEQNVARLDGNDFTTADANTVWGAGFNVTIMPPLPSL